MELTNSVPPTRADVLRDSRQAQVKDALLKKVLLELQAVGYTVEDLVVFSKTQKAQESDIDLVDKHRARRRASEKQIENRIKAVEARKNGRQAQKGTDSK